MGLMRKGEANEAIYARIFPGRLSKGDQTKIAILRSAIDIIANEGIETLTFESVGKPLGMNRAQVRYHFSQKQEIVDKAIELMLATLQEDIVTKMKTVKNWKDRLDLTVDAVFDLAENRPEQAAVLAYLYYSGTSNKKHRELLGRMETMGQERLEAVLSEAGKWSAKEITSMVYGIWGVIDGCFFYAVSVRPTPKGFYRREAHRAIERFLRT